MQQWKSIRMSENQGWNPNQKNLVAGFLCQLWLGFHYGIINIAAVKTSKKC